MNNFTKEELEELLSNHWSCGANHEGLYDKLQSMIDSYCEHQYKATGFSEEICQCVKCGMEE